MESYDDNDHPNIELIKTLGQQFLTTRKMLSDFRVLTNKHYLNRLLLELNEIREELIRINGASQIDDGTLIIRTEVLIPFLNPSAATPTTFGSKPLDFHDPAVIRKIVLTSNLTQWMFMAKQLPSVQAQQDFIALCLKELGKLKRS